MIRVICAGSAYGAGAGFLIIRRSWVRQRGRGRHAGLGLPPIGNSQLSGSFQSRKGSLAVVAMSGIEAHVLHADDFLSLMLGDGVPDGHVIGGQVQFVGAGQGSSLGKGSARAGTGSSSR
jgi:hypothetical protein